MFLDTIEERHPERVLSSVELNHVGFRVFFDLPEEHHLRITISIHQRDERLEVYEIVDETSAFKLHFSDGNHWEIDGDASSIPGKLKGYLLQAVGDFDTHSYDKSFVGRLLEQVGDK